LRIKQKRRELRSSLGFYAWIEPKIGNTRQRNPFHFIEFDTEIEKLELLFASN
jgi:hypothetical protein